MTLVMKRFLQVTCISVCRTVKLHNKKAPNNEFLICGRLKTLAMYRREIKWWLITSYENHWYQFVGLPKKFTVSCCSVFVTMSQEEFQQCKDQVVWWWLYQLVFVKNIIVL